MLIIKDETTCLCRFRSTQPLCWKRRLQSGQNGEQEDEAHFLRFVFLLTTGSRLVSEELVRLLRGIRGASIGGLIEACLNEPLVKRTAKTNMQGECIIPGC